MTDRQETITPKELTKRIVDAIHDVKGKAVTIVDMSHIEDAPVSQFIICQGSSSTNVAAIADNIRESLLETEGVKPYNYDGYSAAEWIVIDYGSVLAHVFMPETRLRYRLEELWADARLTDIADPD